MNAISATGVPCYSGSCSEIYLEEAFPESMRPTERLPVAKELGETSLMFLVHPTLSDEYLHYVGQVTKQVLIEAAASQQAV
jgi:dTDP-4-amino-4,6-dideoxygalactose transaminase